MVKKLGTSKADVMKGSTDNDTLLGLAGNDTLYGFAGTDLFYAGTGDDKLYGGTGADLMQGGEGSDTYFVDSLLDDVSELAGQGTDKVVSSISWRLQENFENLVLTGTHDINAFGNSHANVITGNAGDNRIVGNGGRDVMFGGAGSDKFAFNLGTDSGVLLSQSDRIRDFTHGVDKIDLSNIDADRTTNADNAFRFIGKKAFTDNVATPPSTFAEVRYNYDPATGTTLVIVNIERSSPTVDAGTGNTMSGDTVADMQIILKGNITLTAADFVL